MATDGYDRLIVMAEADDDSGKQSVVEERLIDIEVMTGINAMPTFVDHMRGPGAVPHTGFAN